MKFIIILKIVTTKKKDLIYLVNFISYLNKNNNYDIIYIMSNKCILEFIYTPNDFPEIYSYYLMDINDINKFKYYYKELKFNPIKNFINNEYLTIDNTTYNVYENNKSEFFITISNYISITKSCDLLSKFYELIDKQIDNTSSDNYLFEETENVVNIINLFNKNKLDNIDEIKNIIEKNPNLINDDEINEINNEINKII